MSDAPDSYCPDVFTSRMSFRRVPAPPRSETPTRKPPRPGQRSILLSARNAGGGAVLLHFARIPRGIGLWRSLSPERSRLEHVGNFPEPFGLLAVARLLASGRVRPAIDEELLDEVEVDGADDHEADLLKLAWVRTHGQLDPRTGALLRVREDALTDALERTGTSDRDGLLGLGDFLVRSDREWLSTWRAEVDAEVDRRAALAGAGEEARRGIRAFVEECVLALGRVPRPDEAEEQWDGLTLRDVSPGPRKLRSLGLLQTGRVRRYRVWVRFRTSVESFGWSDGQGPGWYWDVMNPNPAWMVDATMGPYLTAERAWSDASMVGQDEE